jgi:hypothetical protein
MHSTATRDLESSASLGTLHAGRSSPTPSRLVTTCQLDDLHIHVTVERVLYFPTVALCALKCEME